MNPEIERAVAECDEKLDHLRGIFDLAGQRAELTRLEKRTSAPEFWDQPEQARPVVSRLKAIRSLIEGWEALRHRCDDLSELAELLADEEESALEAELQRDLAAFRQELARYELQTYLDGEHDRCDAILTIHPGAGGTESQDWALMLHRMYLRWIERSGLSASVLDFQEGEEAGIKDSTIEVRGDHAYGYLRAEVGVHRLVRISPFDFNQRRHTSFASVFVYPEIEEGGEVELRDDELRIDTFRSSGAGGQHVNKTESAVRITHLPTGIVVQCQAERSQHRNRESALKVLRARLYHQQREAERKRAAKLEATKKEIAWGSQIRSYVLHPYTLVKDHRTGHQSGNVQAVLDGDLDGFIEAYLRARPGENRGGQGGNAVSGASGKEASAHE
ncbi:MAG: peptide chain release factor 2 [Candidatus Eisenbacteria bacterium]|nr:peptide chain release factor 2 [Candidatus Eisenbacteria bacterium]